MVYDLLHSTFCSINATFSPVWTANETTLHKQVTVKLISLNSLPDQQLLEAISFSGAEEKPEPYLHISKDYKNKAIGTSQQVIGAQHVLWSD